MKILAFNGSPRKENGATSRVLDMFLGAADIAGAEIKRYNVVDLNINGCKGCFGCWWGTPGKCVQRDDMDWLLEEYLESDVIVWGSPVYHDNMIHYLQRLRERTLPTALPEFILANGETTHPARYQKRRKNVVIATAGFPEPSAFDVIKRLFQNGLHITLPASAVLHDAKNIPLIQDFIKAVGEAGEKIANGEPIDEELCNRLNVVYPPDIKDMIIKVHNERSAKITPPN